MSDDPLRRLGDRQRGVETDPDPETAERLEHLLPPLEGDERSDLLDGVFARLSSGDAASDEDDEGSAPKVASLGEARQRRSVWVAAAIALAAALLLWFGLRSPSTGTSEALTLPPYSAARLEGGARTMRSGDDDADVTKLELGPDDRVKWEFKPEAPVTHSLAATVVAVPPTGDPVLRPIPSANVSPRGVVTVEGPLSEIVPLSPGPWNATVLIGTPDAIPTAADAVAPDGPWARVAFELNVVAP